MGGLTFTSGDEALPPVRQGGHQAQYVGGLHAFASAMTVFYCQRVAGIGQHVDQSIFEAWSYQHEFPIWSFTGRIHRRSGIQLNPIAGYYPTKDGYCGIMAYTQADWEALRKVIGNPALEDPKFAIKTDLWKNSDELSAYVMAWTSDHTKREMYEILQKAKIPSGMIATAEDLLTDPQLKYREFFTELDHPIAGKLTYPTMAAKLSETPGQLRRAPLLGEHNEEIYCGRLGFYKKEIVRLRQLDLI